MDFETLEKIVEFIFKQIGEHEPIIRFVAYVFSPILAILAFVWGRKDKAELKAQSVELGRTQAEAKQAHLEAVSKAAEVADARRQLDKRGAEISDLEADLARITEGAGSLWKLRPAKPFPEYYTWMRDPKGAKLITVGNLKGGVGKTTIAMNLAAHISETRQKPVLLIDLDYQATLSNSVLQALGSEDVEGHVQTLFGPSTNLTTVAQAATHLSPVLKKGWIIPSDYTLNQIENQLLLSWILKRNQGPDYPYRLAHTVLRPDVRQRYSAIIFDMPPRMTMGSVNALVASHYFLVPTILDKLSAQAVAQFISQMKAIKSDLNLDIDLAGIVGNMTMKEDLNEREKLVLGLARDSARLWRDDERLVISRTMPKRAAISNGAGDEIAYFATDSQGKLLKDLFAPIFEEILANIRFDDVV